jgi:CRP-like cAMP-binding protein
MVRSGAELQSSMLLLDGWAVRSKDLPSGDRQITEIHVPGDFPDLHGFTLKRLDHDVMSVTECVVGIVPFERLSKLTDEWPHLTRVYWLATNIDAAITRETALSLGQRSAISRMAHLFCELHARLSVIGRTDGDSFEFPLTQRELGEALGLTVVHVNRTLQLLRKKGLVESQNRNVAILDRRGLETIADFDPAYLQLRRRQLA